MFDSSTSRKYRRYPQGKRKRHLYLTEPAYQHLVDLADASNVFPSEICEQIIRHHIAGTNIPYNWDHAVPHQITLPDPPNNDGLANYDTNSTN